VLWGKDKLPMFDSLKAVNTLPPGLPGWPVCRGCRIAMWALPYGAWVTAGAATVMTCPDDQVERRFVQQNLLRALRIQQAGFSRLPADASAETVTLEALREHGRAGNAGATLWMFKNDNQDAWLRGTATRGGIPVFLRRLFADPESKAGWDALQRALTRRDKDGAVTASGVAAAAKTLFDPGDRPGRPSGDRLQRELLRQAGNLDRFTGQTLTAWRALCRLYLEVVHGMDTAQLKPARELITAWITADPNPRGRYNRYAKAAGRWTDLQRLLMEAANRLLLDGGHPPDVTSAVQDLLAPDLNGWRLRGLLFFDVVAELVNQGVPIGHKAAPDDDTADDPAFDPPASDDETEEQSA
jgi:CRISPR-associated protein Cst1